MSNITIHHGDCLPFIKTLADNSIDSCCTDPPYGMSNHTQQDIVDCLIAWTKGEEYHHGKKGFMGKEWDSFVPSPTVWREVFRVLKPGGHILCAASSRTSDLMGISLRLAGFEIRDTVEWIYGSGFPKSANISKQIDKAVGAERKVVGLYKCPDGAKRIPRKTSIFGKQSNPNNYNITESNTQSAKHFDGMGTALKPAHEPFILARKPIEKGLTIAQNCQKWGTGGIDIDGCRVAALDDDTKPRDKSGQKHWNRESTRDDILEMQNQGRFPANIIHDGSDCVTALFPEQKSGQIKQIYSQKINAIYGKYAVGNVNTHKGSEGSAARFFYCAKASQAERSAGLGDKKNKHCTVKPVALMTYLIKLITRPGQVVIDPFMGSGTTGVAAKQLGRDFIGCELDADYFEIAKARNAAASFVAEDIPASAKPSLNHKSIINNQQQELF